VIIDTIWQDFLKIVREEVGSRVVETWFKAVKLVRWDAYEKVVHLQAPNLFVKNWILQHYKDLFRRHLGRLLNEHEITIAFLGFGVSEKTEPVVSEAVATKQDIFLYEPAKQLVRNVQDRPKRLAPIIARRVRGLLNESYIFETFVVGPSNTLAFAAAQAAAENAGRLYNPLFIYGGSGLGKTHLLHAVGNYIMSCRKKAVVLYQSADSFVHDFIAAIRFNKVYQFEARYKDVDVLLIDDIQFISNKEQTQEIFFHIFNMLHQANKQIVFTSDSMPCDIAGLAKRMRSRLEGGLIADIHMPSLETMSAILQKKAAVHGVVLPTDVASYIASRGCSNVRELEGMLIRVTAVASLTNEPVSLELAERVLAHAGDKKKESIGLREIAALVAKYFGYSLHEMRSSKRHKDLVQVRHISMYFMKKFTKSSLREIGQFFQRKDHSTVIHACEKIDKRVCADQVFAQELRSIEQEIGMK
jgi:chromosomal replication initiator protein